MVIVVKPLKVNLYFPELLRLVAEIPGIGRLRYTTSHPLEFLMTYSMLP
jgi:tRNA A37 methylthiotransferase MiaB